MPSQWPQVPGAQAAQHDMTVPRAVDARPVADAVPPSRSEVAGAQTLRRGLAVLRLLTRVGPGGLRVGEVGRRLGLNKSTAIRLTRTLVD
ncbi:MAG: hypothetical protein RL375_889, partial [Pseudomonadota bacterium]